MGVAASTAVLGVIALIAYQPYILDIKLINADSADYLNWGSIRGPGYPLLLELIRLFSPDFSALRWLQALLLIASTAFLAETVRAVTGRAWLALAYAVAIFLWPMFWEWTATVGPEALFLPLTQLVLGAWAMAVVTRRPVWAVVAGLAIGYAIIVRPSGYAFIPGMLLVALFLWVWRARTAAVTMIAGAAAIVFATMVANGVIRGYYGTQAIGHYLLLAKVAPLLPEGGFGDTTSRELSDATRVPRGMLKSARAEGVDIDTAYWLTRQSFDPVFSGVLRHVFDDPRSLKQDAPAIAFRAVWHDPSGFLWVTVPHFYASWTQPWWTTEDQVRRAKAFLASPAFKEFVGERQRQAKIDYRAIPQAAYYAKLAIGLALAALCCVLPVIALWRGRHHPLLVFAGAAATYTVFHNLIVAVNVYSFGRFFSLVLPGMVLVALLTLAWGMDVSRRARRAPAAVIPHS